eukprot:XP_001709394.1 Hypothetical protein GL50803_113902 [Giardia lamblia ATCC 50803]
MLHVFKPPYKPRPVSPNDGLAAHETLISFLIKKDQLHVLLRQLGISRLQLFNFDKKLLP